MLSRLPRLIVAAKQIALCCLSACIANSLNMCTRAMLSMQWAFAIHQRVILHDQHVLMDVVHSDKHHCHLPGSSCPSQPPTPLHPLCVTPPQLLMLGFTYAHQNYCLSASTHCVRNALTDRA